jgi:hypothetical protein
MSFVKVLFGTLVTSDFTLGEDKVGFTESDHLYSELVEQGKVKLFATKKEAEEYQFKSSMELFHESFKSLNPPEGMTVPAPTLDFKASLPIINEEGVPSNIIPQSTVEKSVPTEDIIAPDSQPNSTSPDLTSMPSSSPASKK